MPAETLPLIDHFRENLKRLMQERGVGVRQLGRESEVNYVTISRILNGHLTNLTMDLCESLAQALGVPAEEMFRPRRKKSS